MTCSINKVSLVFTCKNFMFSNFIWKKNFYSKKCPPTPPRVPPFLYGPAKENKSKVKQNENKNKVQSEENKKVEKLKQK